MEELCEIQLRRINTKSKNRQSGGFFFAVPAAIIHVFRHPQMRYMPLINQQGRVLRESGLVLLDL